MVHDVSAKTFLDSTPIARKDGHGNDSARRQIISKSALNVR
jgi:hypothetical protein